MGDLVNGIPRVDPTGRQHSWLRRAVGRVLATKPGSTVHRKLAAPLDAQLLKLSRGHISSASGIVPLVVLRTTGAKSGLPRDVPLGYFTDADDVILIASNYGQAKYPSWYHNLLKNPECELFPSGRTDRGGRFVARPTEGAERDRLFGLVETYMSNFVAYAANTEGIRTIPVLRLSPKS